MRTIKVGDIFYLSSSLIFNISNIFGTFSSRSFEIYMIFGPFSRALYVFPPTNYMLNKLLHIYFAEFVK